MNRPDHIPSSSLAERFRRALEEDLPAASGGERLLVGCSGGADSTALLRLVAAWVSARGDGTAAILVGHVHHGMRGVAADSDEAFVRELAARLGFECLVERVQGELRPTTEGEAREVRYDVFRRWARERELDAILLAHHREDQQETVLLRLCRGAGVTGLTGMRRSRRLEGVDRDVCVLRPLLDISRDELLGHLEGLGQDFRHDEMNDDLSVPRNRVRRDVLPLLEKHVHPGTRNALARLAEQCARLGADIDELASVAFQQCVTDVCDDEVALDRERLVTWPATVRRGVLRRAEQALRRSSQSWLTERRSLLVDALVLEGKRGARVEIGGAMVVESRGDHVVVARGGGTAMAQQCQPVELVINGAEAVWGEWRLRATRGSWPGPSEDRLREWVDEDALRGALTVRSRREGDRFWPFGNEGHKKLKEFQRERGLARAERDSAPLVVSDHEIAWVVGERIGHPFRVRQGTTRAVLLEARRESH